MLEPNLIVGDESNNTLVGTTEDDLIRGLGGNDTISGEAGNDTVEGGSGTDSVNGGAGDDVLVNDFGNADGGTDSDTLSVNYSGYGQAVGNSYYSNGFRVNNTSSRLLNYANIEQFDITGTDSNDSLRGGESDDTIAGGAGDDSLLGLAGNDSIAGESGNDFINSGAGNDSITGGTGDDSIDSGAGADSVDGGAGNDSFIGISNGDTIDGGEGNDFLQINVSDADTDISIDSDNLANFDYNNVAIFNVEFLTNVATGSGNDSFIYNSASSTSGGYVRGNGGNDYLSVDYTGFDEAVGNAIYGDRFTRPNTSIPLLRYSGIEQFDIKGTDFGDSLRGGVGNDTIDAGLGDDSIFGGQGNDSITAGTGNDTLDGYTGNDTLIGGAGNDIFTDQYNNDSMIGGLGDDTFSNITNNDTVDGGEGNDTISILNVSGATDNIELGSGLEVPDFVYGDTSITNIESLGNNITTGSGNDSFIYDTADSAAGKYINASGGNDYLSVDYSNRAEAVGNGRTGSRFEVNNNGNDLLTYTYIERLNITATDFDDSLRGAVGNDTIDAGLGDDSIYGGQGDDSIIAAEGNDTLDGYTGNDTLIGGAGNDSFIDAYGNDSMLGGSGNDKFFTVANNDTVDGGEGNDTIAYLSVNTADIDITLESGIDVPDIIYGDTSIINIESLGNNITTGTGNDSFIYDAADSSAGKVINASTGDDYLSVDYSNRAEAVGNLRTSYLFEANNNGDDLLRYSGIERFNITATDFGDSLKGGSGMDTISAGSGDDSIFGAAGNDLITAAEGNDTLDGYTGNDTLSGGAGSDSFLDAYGDDSMLGGADNDSFFSLANNDTVDGGAGYDSATTVNISEITDNVTIESGVDVPDFVYGDTSIINIESIDNITTGAGNDTFTYNEVDSIAGKVINANRGNDLLNIDYSDYERAIGNTRYGNRFEVNNNGDDLLIYLGIEELNIAATAFNDSLRGAGGNDTIDAGEGNDSVYGSSGNDFINGSNGNDTIDGYTGNDTLIGGAGDDLFTDRYNDDSMIGGAGDDTFSNVANNDTVDGGDGLDFITSLNVSSSPNDIILGSGISVPDFVYGDTSIINIESLGNNINTGTGNDSFVYDQTDSIAGKSINGGAGNDYLSVDYSNRAEAVGNGRTGSRFEVNNNGDDLLTYTYIERLNITATDFNDSLRGAVGNDTIDAGLGDDSIYGGQGDDSIIAAEGNDTLDGYTGNDTLIGGAGDDLFTDRYNNDSMIGGAGFDTFSNINNNDTVDGGEGNDTISILNVSGATDDIELGSGLEVPDFVYGDTSITNIESLGNNITTGTGNDSFIYDAADSISGKIINGSGGSDYLSLDYSNYGEAVGNSRYRDRFEANNNGEDLFLYRNIEQLNIVGTNFDDSLIGSSGRDTIKGGQGNDYLQSVGGGDSIVGGEGDDTITAANRGDIIDGGAGFDYLQNLNASDAKIDISISSDIPIDLDYGTTSVVTSIKNVESVGNVTTGSGDDRFIYNQADSISGRSINANGGNDYLSLDYSGYSEAIGNTRYGSRIEVNNNGADLFYYYSIEQLELTATDFNDSLRGTGGDDSIVGGAGFDSIVSYQGSDRLSGGAGDDTLAGGTGRDSFVFDSINEGVDTITDFNVSDDTLVFDAGIGEDLVEGTISNSMFTVGAAATSDEHRFIYNSGTGSLFYDSDGTGVESQSEIARLSTNLNLTQDNFVVEL